MFFENGRSIVKQRLALFEDIATRNYQYASINKTRSSLQNLLDIDEGLTLKIPNEIEEEFDDQQQSESHLEQLISIEDVTIVEENKKNEQQEKRYSPIKEKNESSIFKKVKTNELSSSER